LWADLPKILLPVGPTINKESDSMASIDSMSLLLWESIYFFQIPVVSSLPTTNFSPGCGKKKPAPSEALEFTSTGALHAVIITAKIKIIFFLFIYLFIY
jgi:hypothetical protein